MLILKREKNKFFSNLFKRKEYEYRIVEDLQSGNVYLKFGIQKSVKGKNKWKYVTDTTHDLDTIKSMFCPIEGVKRYRVVQ